MVSESNEGGGAEERLSSGQRNTLSTTLVQHESFRAPERLTLAPALAELALLLDDYASGRRQIRDESGDAVRSADRRSLVSDVQWALEDAGANVQQAITPSLRELRSGKVAKLGAIVEDRHAAKDLVEEVRSMLHQLGSVRTVMAAWEDLVAAVVDNSTPNRQISLRVAQVAEMIELHGRSWDSSITYALSEHAAKNQLAEAEDLLRRSPFLGAEVVWLAFGNAHLRQGYQRLGAIQFFDMRFSLADLRNGSAELDAFDDFEKAPELTDELVHKMFFEVHAEAHVLARVELTGPHGLPAPLDRPIRRARQLARSVVEAAGFLNGGSQWELLEGGAAFGGGKYMGTLNFRDPSELARRAATTHPTHELTGFGLTQLPAAFGSAIRREDPTALRAMTELDWHQQTSRIPSTAMRVTQRIRVFETQWVAGGSGQFGSWEEYVRHYLRDQWCWHEIHDALFAGVASIEHPGHPNYLTDGQRSADVLTAAYRQIMELSSGVYSTYTWKPGAVLQHASEVAAQFVPGTIARRRWRELDRIGRTGVQAAAWVNERRHAFDALLNRAVRQRNAIVHGRTPVSVVVDSVEPFLDQLGGGLVRRWIDAAAGGITVEQSLEQSREVLRNRFDSLDSEESGFALWPAEP